MGQNGEGYGRREDNVETEESKGKLGQGTEDGGTTAQEYQKAGVQQCSQDR